MAFAFPTSTRRDSVTDRLRSQGVFTPQPYTSAHEAVYKENEDLKTEVRGVVRCPRRPCRGHTANYSLAIYI